MYSNKENVNILTAQLVKHGVEHVIVCPGSRNAPLVHNFSLCPDLLCHSVTDERSAGFVALGLSQQTESPIAVCVTSGSAVLNLIPAAAEATYQHRGIIVISADRPQEWTDQLDGQTYPQVGCMGNAVGKSVSLPEIKSEDDRWFCNRLINEVFITLNRAPYPSVHINVPISEPLFEFDNESLPEVKAVRSCKWEDEIVSSAIIRDIEKSGKPMIILGQMGKYQLPDDYIEELSERVVLLAEPLSTEAGLGGMVDEMLAIIGNGNNKFHPDYVLYLGGHTISKRLRQFIRALPNTTRQVIVSDDGTLHDISQHTDLVIEGKPGQVISDINGWLEMDDYKASDFHRIWEELRDEVRTKNIDYNPTYSQMLAVKLFEAHFNNDFEESIVYYANSTAVRLASIYARHYCYCNRGLNGIEGSLSVAVGASMANPDELVYCVIGDLSFLYDENALWQNELNGNLRILLLNNHQGGIFRNLKGLEKSEVRDSSISGRHNVSAEGICKQFGVKYQKAYDEESLIKGLKMLHKEKSTCPILLEVFTNVNEDEKAYKNYYTFITCK